MRPAQHNPNGHRGFTLVEVLVALVIVAVGMSALLSALGAAADNTIYLRDKTFAQWVALNRIAEVRLQAQRPTEGKTNGEVEFAGRRWRWEQEVTALEVPGVVRMDVKVQPADTGGSTQKGPWLGTAIGVVGDAIARPISPIAIQSKWQAPPQPVGGEGGSGDGQNGDGENPGDGATPPPPTSPPPDEPVDPGEPIDPGGPTE